MHFSQTVHLLHGITNVINMVTTSENCYGELVKETGDLISVIVLHCELQ